MLFRYDEIKLGLDVLQQRVAPPVPSTGSAPPTGGSAQPKPAGRAPPPVPQAQQNPSLQQHNGGLAPP